MQLAEVTVVKTNTLSTAKTWIFEIFPYSSRGQLAVESLRFLNGGGAFMLSNGWICQTLKIPEVGVSFSCLWLIFYKQSITLKTSFYHWHQQDILQVPKKECTVLHAASLFCHKESWRKGSDLNVPEILNSRTIARNVIASPLCQTSICQSSQSHANDHSRPPSMEIFIVFNPIVSSAKWYVEGHHSPSYPIGAQVKKDIHDIDREPKSRPREW